MKYKDWDMMSILSVQNLICHCDYFGITLTANIYHGNSKKASETMRAAQQKKAEDRIKVLEKM